MARRCATARTKNARVYLAAAIVRSVASTTAWREESIEVTASKLEPGICRVAPIAFVRPEK